MKKRTLLIDADILVVSTAAGLEEEVEWEEDVWSLSTDVGEAKEKILAAIEGLKEDLDATDVILLLSRGETFRHGIYPEYKSKRTRKPVGTKALKDWLIEEHGARVKPGLEADDQMGILSTHPKLKLGDRIIVSQDKDMKTIPGKLYRDGLVTTVTPAEADHFWLWQTLTGDTTDGYPGCPGVGPETAERFLREEIAVEAYDHIVKSGPRKGQLEVRYREIPAADPWHTVVSLYEKAGLTEEDAILQAQLARILRASDYDFEKKEVILWTP